MFFVWGKFLLQSRIHHWDERFFLKVNKLQSRFLLRCFLRVVSFTGDGYLYIIAALYCLWSKPEDFAVVLATLSLAFCIDLPSFMLMKKIVKRRRPFQRIASCQHAFAPADQFSMPSGHAAAAALFAVQVSHFYPQYTVLAYLWAFLVGFSRVCLGVHYPLDVLVGFCLGACCSWVSLGYML